MARTWQRAWDGGPEAAQEPATVEAVPQPRTRFAAPHPPRGQLGQHDGAASRSSCPLPAGSYGPVERFFDELWKGTANRVFTDLGQIEQLLQNLVRDYIQQPQKVKQLTQYLHGARPIDY